MRFVTLGEKHYFGFDNIMQKSVLVPFEKYQRLLERSTTPNRDTVEAATETERLPEPPVEERLTEPPVEERLTEPPVEEKTELPVTPIEEKAVLVQSLCLRGKTNSFRNSFAFIKEIINNCVFHRKSSEKYSGILEKQDFKKSDFLSNSFWQESHTVQIQS